MLFRSFHDIVGASCLLRNQLLAQGFQLVGDPRSVSPAVVTVALPRSVSARSAGWQMQKNGFLVSYRSQYLLARNWVQVCLMGEFSLAAIESFVAYFSELVPAHRRQSTADSAATPAERPIVT